MKTWLPRVAPVAPVGLLAALLVTAVPTGCGPSGGTRTTGTTAETAATDPWPRFVAAVRNNPDPKTARGVVVELTAGLAALPPDQRPKAPDPAAVDAAVAGLNLTDAERKYLLGGEYAPLDASHLSECLYLHDVATALGVGADPVPARADAAFRFVCRQVVLRPWVVGNAAMPPVPPTFVLNRGWGSGLERAVTFVALCRQLGLDAYLVGPADAAGKSWTDRGTAAEGAVPHGPFWGVGVRHAGGVILFDPWRGEPVPTTKAADRPATLAELRADPTACPWLAGKETPWGVTAEQVKASGLFLAPPLPALAPRTAVLQEKLTADGGVQVAVDWTAAVQAAEAAADGAPVGGWNPKGDAFSPVRALGSFLPTDQGGLDTTPEKSSVYVRYHLSMLPTETLRPPVEVINPLAADELRTLAAQSFGGAFLEPPTQREMIQRGQYYQAIDALVKRRDDFEKLLDRGRAGAEDLTEWYGELKRAFDQVSEARNTPAEDQRRQQAAAFLRGSGRQVEQVIGGMVAEVAVGEATYLLALAAHEQAEAAEVAAARGGEEARGKAKGAWASAAAAWRRFAQYADGQESSFPGRKENAAALQARGERLAK